MDEFRIIVGSVTKAQLAQKVLADNGIHSRIKRSKSLKKGYGCGYGLEVKGDKERIKHILRVAEIDILSIGEQDDIS